MRLARNVRDTRISAHDVGPRRPQRQDGAARRDLIELQRLMRVLESHVAVHDADARRALALVDGATPSSRSEPHLRALSALLVSLATYQELKAGARAGTRPIARARGAGGVRTNGHAPGGHTSEGRDTNGGPVNGRPVNGRTVNGRASAQAVDVPALPGPDRELAAAAASYIARDLAARQLSEFTSAEGYRLARALAEVGRVEAPVERLLTEANQVRLHPMPLADAVSHSAR